MYIYIERDISVAILAQVPLPLCLKSFNSGPWPAATLNNSICSLHLFLIGTVCFLPQSPCAVASLCFFSMLKDNRSRSPKGQGDHKTDEAIWAEFEAKIDAKNNAFKDEVKSVV